MARVKVMCAWCHQMVLSGIYAGCVKEQAVCPDCGHQAGIPRLNCQCVKCYALRRAAAERPELDLEGPNGDEDGIDLSPNFPSK